MCVSSLSICWKAAAPARAALSLPPNTSPRNSRSLALQPAGDNGTYFQKVPLFAVHTIEDKTNSPSCPRAAQPVDLTYGSQIVSKDETGQPTADFDAPIVFVGYGIHAPEYNWDDYAGVDLKGKIALVIVNEPPSDDEKFFKGKALTYYGRWTYKYEEAARRGAVGVLIIHRTDLASYGWEVVRNSQAIEKSYLAGDPQRHAARRRVDPARCGAASLHACRPRRSRPGNRASGQARLPRAGTQRPPQGAHRKPRSPIRFSTNVVGRVPGRSANR